MNQILKNACLAVRKGFEIKPLLPRSKKPAGKGTLASELTTERHFRKNTDHNYGVLTGKTSGVVVIDIDGSEGAAHWKQLSAGKPQPRTVRVKTPNGEHKYFRYRKGDIHNSASQLGIGIDVRGEGGYVVGAGSVHPNGQIYEFVHGRELGNIRIADLPAWLKEKLVVSPKALDSQKIDECQADIRRAQRYAQRVVDLEYGRIKRAPVHQRNDTLNKCAFYIGRVLKLGELDESKIVAQLGAIAHEIGLEDSEIQRTILSGLNAGKARPRTTVAGNNSLHDANSPNASKDFAAELAKLPETDADNAARFQKRCGDKVMHTPGLGWLVFDGKCWRPDTARSRVTLAIEVAKRIEDEIPYVVDGKDRLRFSLASRSKAALDRMLDVAAPGLHVTENNLDRSPDLLCVRNGTISLRTGELRAHDPRDLITKMVDIDYDLHATAPTFLSFLERATGGNQDLTSFLHRAIGYTLTGHVREKAFFFLYGPTDSGKTTLLGLLAQLLGDHAQTIPMATLMAHQYDNNIPNDLARLKGARVAVASESNHNRSLDEAKVKLMTGGDKIAARFLHKEWFEFVPQFKIWMAANDFPRVRASDPALWGRIRVVDFAFTVKGEEMDKGLNGRLERELPGILAWAVRGARRWYQTGLGDSAAVNLSTKKWRAEADIVKRFYQECCAPDAGGRVLSVVMRARFEKWCSDNGETALSGKQLFGRLVELNATPKRSQKERFWSGVKLTS